MTTLLAMPSAPVTAGGSSAPLSVPASLDSMTVNVNVTAVAGTAPTLTVFVEGLDAAGVWYPVWAPTVISTVVMTTTSIGPGLQTAVMIPPTIRFRWLIGGSAGQSVTFSASIVARSMSTP